MEHKDIARTGEKVLTEQRPIGRPSFEGLLAGEAKELRFAEVRKWPLIVQFITFAAGVLFLLAFGASRLWSI
jgi:hypothetical protein